MGSHYIVEACILCGTCEPVCQVNAISEGDPQYNIDNDTCTDCGDCDEICPVDAIEWETTDGKSKA